MAERSGRIVHLIGTADEGGTGILRLVDALAAGSEARGHEVEYWFLGGPGPLVDRVADRGRRAVALRWDGTRHDLPGVFRFAAQLLKRRPSLLCQHSGGRLVRRLARLFGARVVLHVHGYVRETEGHEPVTVPGGGEDAHAVIANSRATAEQAGLSGRVHVIHPGVEAGPARPYRDAPRPENTFVIGTAGRLVAVKGLDVLIDAVSQISVAFPDIRLEVAGSGPERRNLESAARAAGIEDRLTFLGWREDLSGLFAGWDLFILPSWAEGFGLAALEAMAAGVPVVASDVGGLTELVEAGRTGWLVPVGDATALASTISGALRDPETRHAVGEAGRQRASAEFSAARMVDATLEVYAALLGGSEA